LRPAGAPRKREATRFASQAYGFAIAAGSPIIGRRIARTAGGRWGTAKIMGVMASHDEVLDLVYDTSIDPTLWPRLLERFASLIGGHAAALRSYELFTETGVVMAVGVDSTILDRQFRAFADRNPLKSTTEQLRQKFVQRNTYVPGWKRDIDWLPKAQFERTDYYNEVYRPLDIHSDISIGFTAENTTWTGVDVYRSRSAGAFSDQDLALVDALLPHLARAWKLGRKVFDSRARGEGLADFVDVSPHGLFILDGDGRLQHANVTGRRLLEQTKGLRMLSGRLTGVTQDASRRLQALIDRAGSAAPPRIGGAMALDNPDGLRPLSVTVTPTGPEYAAPLLSGPGVMVCVTDLDANASLPEQRLRDLFDLTPAETRVAAALFEGLEPRMAAERLDISVWTVRRHLAQIFEKTRTNSQVELARLMMRTIGA
jgi:DNA-binding CsgD family transcriptional regulator/PAS domain-containing protein